MSTLLEQASLVLIPSGYKEDVVYSQIPTSGAGDLSFTRASNGTRVNSAGLVEVCPWNLVQQSETFDNAGWIKNDSTITANATTAPNGTLTADKLIGTNSTSQKAVYQNLSLTGTNTFFCYCKSAEFTTASLKLNASITSLFDLSTGTVTSQTNCTASIESVGDGWYKCSITTSNNISYAWIAINSGNTVGDGTKGIYIWGAQLNIGSTAKPYFPTTDRLNVPRLTYQNGGGGCPSLLLEKQSTNLCTYSEDFTNAAWNVSVDSGCSLTITPNYTTASNGLPAARLVASRTNTSTLAVLVNYTPNTGTSATKSIWMKNNNAGNVTIMFGDEAVTITDSWERYSVTNTYIYSIFGLRYSGVALTCDISITGNQFELGSYPTSYIPTTSASATRVADACFKTGISSLIGQTEGTMFVDAVVMAHQDLNTILSINNGSTNEYMVIGGNASGQINAFILDGGVTQVAITSGVYSIGTRVKCALAYKANDVAYYINGVQIGVSTSATMPTTNQINIGGLNFLTAPLQGKINQAVLFPTRLTNAELASLTTI
jgi:hypothetical protein